MKRVALAAVAVVVVLLVAAQLVLPGVAERRAREQLAKVGVVTEVEVSSFPAVKLLAGEVDSLTARVRDAETTGRELGDLIAQTEGVDRLRVAAAPIRLSGLRLQSGRLVKDGDRLIAEATTDREGLEAVLPAGSEIRQVSSDGSDIVIDGSFSLFGFRYNGPVRVSPDGGAVTASPDGLSLASLAQLTLFEHPRVRVARLGAREAGDRIVVSAEGRLAE